MRLVELLNRANEGYPDGYLVAYYDTTTGELIHGIGDSLARWIVVELIETFEPDTSDEEQMENAVAQIEKGIENLEDVRDALLYKKAK